MSYLPTNADEFVTAVNDRGEKQQIPRRWLDHPVLGAGFRLPASDKKRTAPKPPAPIPGADKTPVAGDDEEN